MGEEEAFLDCLRYRECEPNDYWTSWRRSCIRRFLIATENIVIDPSSVRSGTNTKTVVTICRCVNVGLFLSGALRRDVEVTLIQGEPEDLGTVTFPGHSLKRVSPDERSVSFFLLKAMNILQDLTFGHTHTMDCGIVVKRCRLADIVQTEENNSIVVAAEQGDCKIESLKSCAGLFLYDLRGEIDKVMERHNPIKVVRSAHPERFILEINLHCDRVIPSN